MRTFQGPFLAQSSSDKSSWDLTASSIANGQNLDLIVDGDHVTEYATVAPSQNGPDKHPWIQIDLGTQHIVKSVHMYR